MPQELSGLQFYNERESGEGEKITFFLILEYVLRFRHQLFLHGGQGSLFVLIWSSWDCQGTMERSKKALTYTKNGKSSQAVV